MLTIALLSLLLFLFLGVCAFIIYHPHYNADDKKSQFSQLQEFILLSMAIDTQPETNYLGGVIGQEKYFQYSYATNYGDVVFKQRKILIIDEGMYLVEGPYIFVFKRGFDNKIIKDGTYVTFIMSDEMYKQVFKAK